MARIVYTAEDIINEALVGIRDFDRKRYPEAVIYFGQIFRDYAGFHSVSVKDLWADITLIKTIDYPDDYFKLISIGIVRNGEIVTFSKSGKMLTPTSDPLQQTLSTTNGESDDIVRVPLSGYNAKGINTDGYFFEDVANNRIVLKDMFLQAYKDATRTQVLLRYVSNGYDDDLRHTYIPINGANMLIKGVQWMLVDSMPEKYPANYRQERRYYYEMAADQFDLDALPDIDELYDAIYETAGQSGRVL